MKITLMVTSKCQLDCRYCTQARFRELGGGSQMSMADLHTFARRVRELGIDVEEVSLSGGEPLLWDIFEEGVWFLVHEICENLRLVSNGLRKNRVSDKVLGLFKTVVMSDKNKKTHYPLPTEKITDEVDCRCSNIAWELGEVHRCSGVLGVMTATGRKWPDWIMDIEDDWRCLEGRQGEPCGYCLANGFVRKAIGFQKVK